jgi:hypothetical protein
MRVVVRTRQSFQHEFAIVWVADRFHSANTFFSAGLVWPWLSGTSRRYGTIGTADPHSTFGYVQDDILCKDANGSARNRAFVRERGRRSHTMNAGQDRELPHVRDVSYMLGYRIAGPGIRTRQFT